MQCIPVCVTHTPAACVHRWRRFAAPPSPEDEDGAEYYQRVTVPMDLATILSKVNNRQYLTTAAYLADFALIVQGAKEYYGTEGSGTKAVALASALQVR